MATGLGEISMCTVESEPAAVKADGQAWTPTDLTTLQDWVIRPQLRNLKGGVTEVNIIGGHVQQYHATPDPAKLVAFNLMIDDLRRASNVARRT